VFELSTHGAFMKWFLGFAVVVWLLCGLFGAWWMDSLRVERIARGPFTLMEALDDRPMTTPGPY
jgi:hypothetical protein